MKTRKEKKHKANWLRTIEIQSVTLPKKGTPEFDAWEKERQREQDRERDIMRIISERRAAIEEYLPRIGFTRNDRGIYRKTIAGKTVWLSSAYEEEPIAHSGWRQLESMKSMEAAIAAGDIKLACFHAFLLGQAWMEGDAIHAFNAKFAKKKGAHGPLKPIYFDALARVVAAGGKPDLNSVKHEMVKGSERCRRVAGVIEYKTTDGTWEPIPKRFKSTVSDWLNEDDKPEVTL